MTILDRYLLRRFTVILGMAIVGFVVVFVIVDMIENLDQFIDNHVPVAIVLKYYFYTLPWFVNIGLPMSMLIATVFSVGLMVKRNEWAAMKSSGVSLYRIAIPLLVLGVVMSIVSFQLENRLVSWGNEQRFTIERKYLKSKSRRRFWRHRRVLDDVFLQKQREINIALSRYRVRQQSAEGVTVVYLRSDQIVKRIDAKTITWIDSLSAWAVSNFSIRTFAPDRTEDEVILSTGDSLLTLGFTPDDITKQFKSPEELNFRELTERIALLRENGVDTRRWEVARYFKISFSFTNLIVVLFGLPLVVMRPKGGLTFGAGMSVFVIFAYYVFIKFGQSLGYKAIVDPITSAWLGNIVFSVGGILLLRFTRK
jgi:lipopolysaccharide export system permease protein